MAGLLSESWTFHWNPVYRPESRPTAPMARKLPSRALRPQLMSPAGPRRAWPGPARSKPGCAGVLLGPGTVDGSQRQIQRRGVVQRPGVAAAIVTESEDGGEFQDDVGTG